ncbi:pyridine nucleotide-disulfide oxidoreductase [Arthrobacter sp. Soil782]|uniref:dihydrolipoyl dehydrogenase family protein n=1 Tax=Arthrobacter sp. Soil782 TaxID=1736410 RepID=UPI0006FF7CBE|nr:NAD(P)/FAD-dependent oxidoreductase [Arthrobacter sp. Soil782]KRF09560.1 pyridine nucleotide-disulfide oxidoreductase [Arthrobacter sp. Soil782]
MSAEQTTDVIVIGAGAVGENAAARVIQGGLSATLVESELVGGECSYWACMPSKALLRPGSALHSARAVAGSREAVTGTLDAQQVLARRDEFTSHWDDSSQVEWVKKTGITLIRGRARLTGERRIEVTSDDGATTLVARHAVVLATGSTPTIPPIDGLDALNFWGTREATSAKEVPESLTVLGGGVAGAELAQAYARLGSAVTLIARSGLLGSYPEPAAWLVQQGLKHDGVTLHLNTGTESVAYDAGRFRVSLAGGTVVESEKLLVSTGRHPALTGLGLEELGLGPRRLDTDDSGQVNGHPWLYAVGDAAGKVLLTHQGKYEARMTGDAIVARAKGELQGPPERWGPFAATADSYAVPQVVFTDPEIAMAGRTLETARKDGLNVSETSLELSVAGSSLHADGYAGWAQMVVDEERKVLVGVTFAGPDVAELLHAATIAIAGEVPLHRLWHAVPAYPTISEVWLRLLEKYGL